MGTLLPVCFFSSLIRSEYLSVFSVCSQEETAGEMLAIIVVLEFPVNESLSTCVSLLPLNGKCFFSKSSARMHSFRASSDLLISAPSWRVYLFWSTVSAPLSLPAKSMKVIMPCLLVLLTFLSCICKMAWDRELSALAPVTPLVLSWRPAPITYMMSWTLWTGYSVSPTIFTFYLASSRHTNSFRWLNKSYNFPQ